MDNSNQTVLKKTDFKSELFQVLRLNVQTLYRLTVTKPAKRLLGIAAERYAIL